MLRNSELGRQSRCSRDCFSRTRVQIAQYAAGRAGIKLEEDVTGTVVVTAGSTITPTGTYQVITSTAAVTTSTTTAIANGGETGDLLILRNANASNAITIDGTGGNVECKSDVALGAGDTLLLIWNGSDWNCLSSYDNS